MESSNNETKDTAYCYVIYSIKPKAKDLIFPIKTLSQALRQSNNKKQVLTNVWKQFDTDGRLRLIDSMFYLIKIADS